MEYGRTKDPRLRERHLLIRNLVRLGVQVYNWGETSGSIWQAGKYRSGKRGDRCQSRKCLTWPQPYSRRRPAATRDKAWSSGTAPLTGTESAANKAVDAPVRRRPALTPNAKAIG